MKNKYSKKIDNTTKTVKARGNDLRVHFKNTRETAAAISRMPLRAAQRYLRAVLKHRRCIPFVRYQGGVGRTSQAKEFNRTQGRWPQKSVEYILNLLQNAQANAEAKQLNLNRLYISHIQVNKAPKMRRRTYRAHGRINPYMSSPCHIELILTEKQAPVKKASEKSAADSKKGKKGSKKQAKASAVESS